MTRRLCVTESTVQQNWHLRINSLGVAGVAALFIGAQAPVLAAEETDPLDLLSPTAPTVELEGGLSRFTDPPAPLQEVLEDQLEAANQRDLDALMATYSPEFNHQDGLDWEETQEAIAHLWQEYSDLSYQAEITSWEFRGAEVLAVINTQVEGQQSSVRGDFAMTTTTEVLNRYRSERYPELDQTDLGQLQLVSQEVLRETTTLQSGSAPPTVTLKLPEVVKTGSIYGLEAIVAEPLRDSVLLGAVIEEIVGVEQYQEPSGFPLEPLQAGGLFRQADAPADPGSSWISVMLVSEGGITLESRRLQVTE